MLRFRYVALAVLVALVALFVAAKLRYAGKAATKLPAEACNSDLWRHVYEPERLRIIEPCIAVEGRVVAVYPASDGDLHIGLDPDRKSVLNLINVMHMHGQLVVEEICHHAPTGYNVKADCGDFRPPVLVPNIGDRVRVTGVYVTDLDNNWNEVHPVTRIERIP